MIKVLGGSLAVIIGLPLLLVVVIMGPQGAESRRSSVATCAHMLGTPPGPDETVLSLGGPQADLVAAQHPAGHPLTGGEAYRFVSTLNTITNWRILPPADVAAWVSAPDQVSAPVPAGAEFEQPWPAPELTADQRQQLATAVEPSSPSTTSMSPAASTTVVAYENACAVVLRRIDVIAEAAQAGSVSSAPVPTLPDSVPAVSQRRAQIVDAATTRIGTAMTDAELWQLISPTPDLDPRQTLLNALATNPDVLVAVALPGDLACYDFTTTGPSRCGLITTAEPASMTVIGADGLLAIGPVPSNSTTFRPV